MTVLSAIQSAVLRMSFEPIDAVFASTERIALDLADLANEVAADIVDSHDWRSLTKIETLTSTGAINYALPDDFQRMPIDAEIEDSTSWFWGYEPFTSVNQWLQFRSGTYAIISPGGWIALGGELQFYPAPIGEAEYPYISNAWAADAGGARKAAFTDDGDTFVLDERLLTLGLIWRYQAQKGYEYSESLATYEMALSKAQARDRGGRIYRSGSSRFRTAQIGYTGSAFR
jgi:hypothetical protein